jgi:hypothetical protein
MIATTTLLLVVVGQSRVASVQSCNEQTRLRKSINIVLYYSRHHDEDCASRNNDSVCATHRIRFSIDQIDSRVAY